MHVFLAGSTGLLGRRIIPLLTGHGHQVTALTRRRDQASMLRSLGAYPAVADAFEPESLAAAVKLPACAVSRRTDPGDEHSAAAISGAAPDGC
jgi:NAD dependent epimerase/dehydratase family enzyme